MVGPFGLSRGLMLSLPHSWDESSSISSGLSDASDNLSSEEFNASSSLNSLPSTPTASRRNSAIAVGASAIRTLPGTYPSFPATTSVGKRAWRVPVCRNKDGTA